MYEAERADFLRQYNAISRQLYHIALLVTGKPDLAVHAVENAALECYRSLEKRPFSDLIYEYLWKACESCAPEWGYNYRRNLCEMYGIDIDSYETHCPELIDALSKREPEERLVLALMIFAKRSPEQIAPLFETRPAHVERALKKICKSIHFNELSEGAPKFAELNLVH